MTCRLCHSTSLKPRLSFLEMTLNQCGECGFEQIDPQPSAEKLEAIYSANYFGKSKYGDETALAREYERRRSLMREAGIKPGQRVLEIGCGVGDFLALIAADYRISGTDISVEAIEQAKVRLPDLADRLSADWIEDFVPEQDGYDAILLWDVIEHLWDGPGALKQIAGWLRPGGKLLISTPDVGAATARLMGQKWAFMTPPEHLSFFSAKTIRKAAEKAGLETMKTSSKGKWANAAFVVYKAGRVGLLPKSVVDRVNRLGLSRLSIYVPTQDVLYAVLAKPST